MPLQGNRLGSAMLGGGRGKGNADRKGRARKAKRQTQMGGGKLPSQMCGEAGGGSEADRRSSHTSSADECPSPQRSWPKGTPCLSPPLAMAYSRQKHRFFVCQYHVSEDGEAPPQDYFQPGDFVAALKVSPCTTQHSKRQSRHASCCSSFALASLRMGRQAVGRTAP